MEGCDYPEEHVLLKSNGPERDGGGAAGTNIETSGESTTQLEKLVREVARISRRLMYLDRRLALLEQQVAELDAA